MMGRARHAAGNLRNETCIGNLENIQLEDDIRMELHAEDSGNKTPDLD
jgi:hypothetical protein